MACLVDQLPRGSGGDRTGPWCGTAKGTGAAPGFREGSSGTAVTDPRQRSLGTGYTLPPARGVHTGSAGETETMAQSIVPKSPSGQPRTSAGQNSSYRKGCKLQSLHCSFFHQKLMPQELRPLPSKFQLKYAILNRQGQKADLGNEFLTAQCLKVAAS